MYLFTYLFVYVSIYIYIYICPEPWIISRSAFFYGLLWIYGGSFKQELYVMLLRPTRALNTGSPPYLERFRVQGLGLKPQRLRLI